MAKLHTAERVSAQDASDNYVFQRSILAYHKASEIVSGRVLEIGTGMGYGVRIVAPHTEEFITIDKSEAYAEPLPENARFLQMAAPPIRFEDESFDYVISFQVIEHIKQDKEFVKEIWRVLKKGGRFFVSTPNAPMSLTRNPWHVREYTGEELQALLGREFSEVEMYGVNGNEKIMEYYEKNRKGVEKITRFDILDLQHRLPRWILQIPYDILNRINRRRLLKGNQELTTSIKMEDYNVGELSGKSFDLYFIAKK